MITITHLATSRSERIVWLMEELELPYRIERFDRRSDRLAPDALKDIHPLGRAPIIRDDDVVLAESGAIVDYILARHGGDRLAVKPADPDFPRYRFWMHFAEGSLMANLLREMSLDRMLPDAAANPGMARVRETTSAHLGLVDGTLSASPFIAGDRFTGADIMMMFPFTTLLRFRGLDLAPYVNIRAYVARLQARPAYVRAMAVAGPDVAVAAPAAGTA